MQRDKGGMDIEGLDSGLKFGQLNPGTLRRSTRRGGDAGAARTRTGLSGGVLERPVVEQVTRDGSGLDRRVTLLETLPFPLLLLLATELAQALPLGDGGPRAEL